MNDIVSSVPREVRYNVDLWPGSGTYGRPPCTHLPPHPGRRTWEARWRHELPGVTPRSSQRGPPPPRAGPGDVVDGGPLWPRKEAEGACFCSDV